MKEYPDHTQKEMAEAFGCQAISKALSRYGMTHYKEQDPEKVKAYLEEMKDILPEKIIYVDESGIDQYFYREYAYALRGEAVTESVSGKEFQRTNLVAAQWNGEIIAPMQYHRTTDAPLFEYWFK